MVETVQIPKALPYGYRRDGKKLVVDPVEGPVRKQLYALYIEHSRKKTVARLLNEAGFRTREGAPFSDTTVGRLLADPIAKGANDDGGHVLVERLIDDATWERCQSTLADKEAGRRVSKTPVHLFAGLAACVCGEKMYVPSDSDKYTCQTCRNKIPAADLERVFFEQFRTSFLVHTDAAPGAGEQKELVQVWPLMDGAEKRKSVETMLDSVVVGNGEIAFRVSYLPSAENAAKRQREQKGISPIRVRLKRPQADG
jgi:site-specific DNA recombinase